MLSGLRVIILGNMLRRIRNLGLGTMSIFSKNRMVEIARRANRSINPTSLSSSVPSSKSRYDKIFILTLRGNIHEIFVHLRLMCQYGIGQRNPI